MLALALGGAALVAEGEIADGMRRLDEATAAATGGEMRDVDLIGQTWCFMIYGCERVRDFDRAGQWYTRMREFCSRTRLPSLLAVCRTHYATVLTERGEWGDAEAELVGAAEQRCGDVRSAPMRAARADRPSGGRRSAALRADRRR